VVTYSTDLVRDTDLRTAATAFALLSEVAKRSPSEVAAAAADRALRVVSEHHPISRVLVTTVERPRISVRRDWKTAMTRHAAVTEELGPPRVSTDLLDSGLAATKAAVEDRRPRHLYGWLSGLYQDGQFVAGRPSSITEDPRYSFRYSVAIGVGLGVDRPVREWGQVPAGAAQLVVALLPDDKHIKVIGMTTQPLNVPDVGPSDTADFTLQGREAGIGRLDIFLYHRGSLIMRAYALLTVGESVPALEPSTAPILSSSSGLTQAIHATDEALTASLLVEREKTTGKLLFVLFAEQAGNSVFEYARVPLVDDKVIEFGGIRKSLRELVGFQPGFLSGPAFQQESPDVGRGSKASESALGRLREIANKLENELFSDPGAERLRKALVATLRPAKTGALQVISDDVFVPWQILYIPDGAAVVDPMCFWGMRFQIRQSTAKGSVRWATGNSDQHPIAFVNETLPSKTVAQHRTFLPTWSGTEIKASEQDVLEELRRPDNERPALYFYCHAGSGAAQDESWLELREGAKLTLDQLKRTKVDPTTQGQVLLRGAPLVFLNACHSGEIESSFYRSFVGFFMHDKQAGALIGTEAEMPAYFATHFANRFWQELPNTSKSLGKLLLELRQEYLLKLGNPLGLLYTLYANGDPRRAQS
jgi:hypothetical protein